MNFASRIQGLGPEGAYRVMALASELESQGRDIIHLEIGQPDFGTFPEIVEAGKDAIDAGFTRYNPSEGYPDIRETIAEYSRNNRSIPAKPQCVVVAPGAKPVILLPLLALVEPGDEVLYPDPGFPSYRSAIELAGAKPVPVPLIESNSFSFDLAELEARITSKTKLLILNSPANPTGGVIPDADLEAIAEIAQRENLWVMSDEIYSRLVYDDIHARSICNLDGMSGRTIVVDGFSKSYAMTGWRLGYAIMPEPLAAKVGLLLTHAVGCTAGFTQKAGVVAIREGDRYIEKIVARYQRRRDLFIGGLNDIAGLSCNLPEGAFYAFLNTTELEMPSSTLAQRLLEEAGIACVSGTDFGANGEGYVRFSYATASDRLRDAVERIGNFIASLRA
ncbi:MAG: aspartate aminotransferase [Opitutales bacterium TMED158]|nr:MAG: aspartate aminotransferase [Opitutales bacterium TMED158]